MDTGAHLCGDSRHLKFIQSTAPPIAMSTIYLIPTVLDEMATHTIPLYIVDAVKTCQVIFAENERTARRFLKSICREIVIDDYEWFTIHKAEEEQKQAFGASITAGKNIAIISEAGCPGIADPGQILVELAQQMNAAVKPLVGPSSILLALMASGMNGQQFEFVGYLPIDNAERIKAIKELEISSQKKNSTQIFIETPYRNNQLIETLLKTCRPSTKICIAAELTGINEYIKTKTVTDWKKEKTDLHKKPVIFLLQV
jgi:16S rRNA (cytidine1402-2'-O)-methyltransferase